MDRQIEEAIGLCGETYSPKKSGIAKTTESDTLTPIERLIVEIEKAGRQGNSVSREELADRLGVSTGRVSQIVKDHKENGFNLIRIDRIDRRHYYSLRSGKGFKKVTRGAGRIETFPGLPAGMDHLIGTRYGGRLKKELFFVVAAYGDRGKSQFLLNLAIHYLRLGLKVAYIRHEADEAEFWSDVGQRLLGRRIQPDEGFDLVYEEVDRLPGDLSCYVAPEESDLREFCEEVQGLKPDVCIYDYMSQELTNLVAPSGKSIIARMVNILGDNIVKQGIPLFTAVQVEDKELFDLNARWLRRSNVAVWITESKLDPYSGMTYTLSVEKNKEGGVTQGQFIRVSCDPNTWEFESSWEATQQVERERIEKQVVRESLKREIRAELKGQLEE